MLPIHHALVLNLHQPAGNLQYLLDNTPWEAQEILFAIDRIPRTLWEYEDVGRVHLAISGTLLETLSNPEFQQRMYGVVDCGALLWHLQNQRIIEILGTAHYHPVLTLIPEADRAEHLLRWQGIASHLFWRKNFAGFWPPEMGFSMELIPLLRRFGYRYVLVDSEHVEPVTSLSWEELRYRPHVARYGGEEIVVVVRDRELSDAQLSGMEYGWFASEVEARTRWCNFPPLVMTATDGDNGGWFRNTNAQANFWGVFYRELAERARGGATVRPTFIPEYLDHYGVHGEVKVRTAAWNTGWHHGTDFVQWTGSQLQKDALARVADASRAVHELRWRAGELNVQDPAVNDTIENAMWHLLRAETSCNFFWGEAWVDRCHRDLDAALRSLELARARL
jgi:alpha-amylase/alpha-mannosidase (GH57 family)